MTRSLPTPLDIPLALLLVGAVVGVWASYDPATSWMLFSVLVLAIALYYGLVLLCGSSPSLTLCMAVLVCAAAGLALYFVTQHDFAGESKLGPIHRLGLLLNQISPHLPAVGLHPNNVAGVLEIALPINLSLVVGERWARAVGVATAFIIAFGLVMTSSRGAWLALALVGSVVGIVWLFSHLRWISTARPRALSWRIAAIGFFIVLGLSTGFLLFTHSPGTWTDRWLALLNANDSLQSRPEVYRGTWNLVRDYAFTGTGLGMFPMVYSTYALLIHVYFLPHAHNLFLQLWVDQGLLGAVGYVGLVLSFYLWMWKRRHQLTALAWAGIAATTVMWLHGLVDAPLYYSTPTIALQFLPMGLAIAAAGSGHDSMTARATRGVAKGGVIAGVLLGAGILSASRPLAVRWYANMGSTVQTQVELGRYQFPNALVEFTRRDADLTRAQAHFEQTLALDPGDVTGNQRLSEIALARGEYDAAEQYGQAAYDRDPWNEVTWQLLGDSYLAQGRMEEAQSLWSRVDNAANKLEIEAQVRYDQNADLERAQWTRTLAQRIRQAGETLSGKDIP